MSEPQLPEDVLYSACAVGDRAREEHPNYWSAQYGAVAEHVWKAAFAAGRKAAAADVKNMPAYLGDEGWEEMCRRAEEAGYERAIVLRRRRGDFTTSTVEGGYQVARDRAARIAAGER